MRHFPAYLIAFLALVPALASCGKKERVIPREEMAEIYAEMYVLDQWLDDNRQFKREADTTLVYAPVLDKYGYTYDDYLNSVSVYMKDPIRYSRILRRTSEILGGRLAELKAEKKAREEALKESRRLDSLRNLVRIDIDSLMKAMSRTNPSDSLVAGLDSLGFVEFHFVQTSDTIFDGPAMVIRIDSAAAASADSLALVGDSLAVVKDNLNAGSVGAERPELTPELAPGLKPQQVPERAPGPALEQAPELRLHEGRPFEGNAKRRGGLPARDTSVKLR